MPLDAQGNQVPQGSAPGSGNDAERRRQLEAQLQEEARKWGLQYEASDLDSRLRNGQNDATILQNATQEYGMRAASQQTGGGQQRYTTSSGSPVTSTGRIATSAPSPTAAGQAPAAYKAGQVAAPQVYQPGMQQTALPQAYTPNTLAPSYKAGTIDQFTAPNQQPTTDLQTDLINRILANPHTLDDATVARLKEAQKDSALAFSQQLAQQALGGMTARGISGGQRSAVEAAINEALTAEILGAYRDIDIQRVAQNRADEQGALELADLILTGQMGRATDAYNTQLGGQKAQEELRMFEGSEGLRRSIAEEENRQAGARSALDVADLDFRQKAAVEDQKYKASALEQAQWQALLEDLFRESESARNLFATQEDSRIADNTHGLARWTAEQEAAFRQAALEQQEWETLLNEAFRRDEQNRVDRLDWFDRH